MENLKVESKFIKKFVAKGNYKAQHNGKKINIIKGETYSEIDKFWEVPLITEKIIERSK